MPEWVIIAIVCTAVLALTILVAAILVYAKIDEIDHERQIPPHGEEE